MAFRWWVVGCPTLYPCLYHTIQKTDCIFCRSWVLMCMSILRYSICGHCRGYPVLFSILCLCAFSYVCCSCVSCVQRLCLYLCLLCLYTLCFPVLTGSVLATFAWAVFANIALSVFVYNAFALFIESKEGKYQESIQSGVDTIKYHTWLETQYGKTLGNITHTRTWVVYLKHYFLFVLTDVVFALFAVLVWCILDLC